MLKRYNEIQEEIKVLKSEMEALQEKLFTNHGFDNFSDGKFMYSCKQNESLKLDQTKVAQIDSRAVRMKYEVDKKAYKTLSREEKAILDECGEITYGKPKFTVKGIE